MYCSFLDEAKIILSKSLTSVIFDSAIPLDEILVPLWKEQKILRRLF